MASVRKCGTATVTVTVLELALGECRAAAAMEADQVVLGAFLAAFDGCNSSWAVKIKPAAP